MRRYEPLGLPPELEALVPILARFYGRIVREHARESVAGVPMQHATAIVGDRRLLLRISEVAEALSISRSSTYALVRSGEIPVVRIGRSVRVSADALRVWISQNSEAL